MRRATASSGVTLIDTIVGTALMLMVFVGIVGAFQLSVDAVANNKARAGAIALGNERMEYLRSLSYTALGTSGGIPAGNLTQIESIGQNGITYTRRTLIVYSDDPKDGTGGSDSNGIPTDYKTVKVEVSWGARQGPRSVSLVSRFQPQSGLETSCTSPCGTLIVQVVNAASQPVANARVAITNSTVNPSVSLTTYTDSNGIASLLGAPVGSGYGVVVSKTGYSSAQTYGSSGQNPSPQPPHVSVANNQTSTLTFGIDLVASKTVVTRLAATGAQIPGVPFTLGGQKIIGSNPTVYKYSALAGAGGTGTTTVSDLEWDTYTISIDPATGYDIASSCNPQPEYLAPGSSQTTILSLAPHTTHSLLVDVRSSLGALVPFASVRLTRTPSYDTSATADACGQSFFPSLSSAGNYVIEASAAGYQAVNVSNVNVSGTSRLSITLQTL